MNARGRSGIYCGMKTSRHRGRLARLLAILGGGAMLAGAVDPLEGSVVILAASGVVTLGTFLGLAGRGLTGYWLLIFSLIAAGVGAMIGLSALGGLGGKSGLPLEWGLLILPYPIGWVMGLVKLVFRMVRDIRQRHHPPMPG